MSRYSTTLDRGVRRAGASGSRRGRRLTGMVLGLVIATATTAGVATALLSAIAYNSPGQSVTSAKLSIALTDNGAGFTQSVSGILPADTVMRYVDVTNNGTADATNLTLAVASSASNKLTTDTTNGLQIAIASCSGTWTPAGGACSGTITPLVASMPLSTLTGGGTTLVSSTFAQGEVARLRVTLSLPAQSETTTNGTLPANSIQNLSTTLTYTFAVTQRAGQTASS